MKSLRLMLVVIFATACSDSCSGSMDVGNVDSGLDAMVAVDASNQIEDSASMMVDAELENDSGALDLDSGLVHDSGSSKTVDSGTTLSDSGLDIDSDIDEDSCDDDVDEDIDEDSDESSHSGRRRNHMHN